jgi:hypothetical protein
VDSFDAVYFSDEFVCLLACLQLFSTRDTLTRQSEQAWQAPLPALLTGKACLLQAIAAFHSTMIKIETLPPLHIIRITMKARY